MSTTRRVSASGCLGTIPSCDVLAAGWQAIDPVLDEVQPLLAAVEPLNEVLEQIKTPIDMVDLSSGLSKVEKAMIEPLAEARAITAIPTELTDPYVDVGDAPSVEPTDFHGWPSWYRSLVTDLIKATLPAKEPRRYLYAPMTEFVDRPAKGLRPALCLATCGAYGGRREDAIPSAAGLELLHNAFLVHDDIEDGGESRRGKPTLQRRVGVPLAVNIGDALNAYATSGATVLIWEPSGRGRSPKRSTICSSRRSRARPSNSGGFGTTTAASGPRTTSSSF